MVYNPISLGLLMSPRALEDHLPRQMARRIEAKNCRKIMEQAADESVHHVGFSSPQGSGLLVDAPADVPAEAI